MQKCCCALTVWHLFTVGRGAGRKKINLRQSPAVTKKRGGSETDREKERWRKSAGKQFSRAQAGSPSSPCRPLFTHREISYNFTAPLSVAIERDRFLPGYSPSVLWEWLLSWENPNLWHPQWVTSLRCATASVQTAAPRNACEICVCVRFRAHCWD